MDQGTKGTAGVRAGWVVSGEVQGVGFRNFVQLRAMELGLRGWVRNLSDGRVEVAAVGHEGELTMLEQYLKSGPRHARVQSVENTQTSDEVDACKIFEVR